jgi:hypothetical protein
MRGKINSKKKTKAPDFCYWRLGKGLVIILLDGWIEEVCGDKDVSTR